MNDYDQSARFAAKADPAGFLRWLMPGLPPGLEFRGWLDARTLPFPGEPDRVCDTVAEVYDPARPDERWALATEFQAEPDRDILDRLLEYLARLRRELRHGPRRRHKYRVAAALVHLTGPAHARTLDMTWPGDPAVGLRLTIASRALRDEDAAATLTEIAEGRATRWLLPWIPLMKHGAKPTIREQWAILANAEPDPRSRADYAALALIFAGLTRHADQWKQTLEGWNVKRSPVVMEWQAEAKIEGKAEGKAESILRLLEARFPAQIPGEVVAIVTSQTDLTELSRWFDLAFTTPSPSAFHAALKMPPAP